MEDLVGHTLDHNVLRASCTSFSVLRCSDSSRCAACCVSRYGVRMQRLRSWARLHVSLSRFACMLRLLSPAIVRKTRGRDCGQRLSRKGARPLSSALPHTVHQGIEATTPDDTRVGNAKISTCTVVCINHFGRRPPQKSKTRSSRQERRRNAELGLLRQRRQKTRQPRELQANAGRQPSEMLSHRQLLYVMFQRSDNVPSASPPGQ